MRAILEVQWGRSRGRKAVLEAGETLRIGRTEHADWVFEHDRSMAAVHCVVQWDGGTARVRDARGLPETLIGGAALADGVVTHGGWIRAGETVVSLHIEAFTPARREAGATWSDEKRRVLESLSAAEPLFAVLDAARDPRILQLLRESVHEAPSLYDGVQGDALASVWLPTSSRCRMPRGCSSSARPRGLGQALGCLPVVAGSARGGAAPAPFLLVADD
ncbi:MAG: FHA domain-containing protein [Polyangiaceae bacterium]|nr:FHA domain-containing protein [Polyangiaceae bacterium]